MAREFHEHTRESTMGSGRAGRSRAALVRLASLALTVGAIVVTPPDRTAGAQADPDPPTAATRPAAIAPATTGTPRADGPPAAAPDLPTRSGNAGSMLNLRQLVRSLDAQSSRAMTSSGDAPAAGEISGGASARVTCQGRNATIVGNRGNNRLRGTAGPDVIVGLGGNDLIDGRGGHDRICGGSGDDILWGGGGHDRVDGGQGSDTAAFRNRVVADLASQTATGEGADRLARVENLSGSPRADTLRGDGRANQLVGGPGNDSLVGRGGNDFLCDGNPSIATCRGGGHDRLDAGPGDDLLLAGTGNDVVNGGPGNFDIVAHLLSTGPVSVDLGRRSATGEGGDRLAGIEGVVGSAFNDRLRSGSRPALMAGWVGNDVIVGTSPLDLVFPLVESAVTINLGSGRLSGEGNDQMNGVEMAFGTPRADVIVGSNRWDALYGGGGNDRINGAGGDDIIDGGTGSDNLAGASGSDLLIGGSGTNRLDGGGGHDAVSYRGAPRGVSLNLSRGRSTGPASDTLRSIESVVGSERADRIIGSSAANRLVGGGGNDSISGGAGGDFVYGTAGRDGLDGGDGNDWLDAGKGAGDRADGGAGSDTCLKFATARRCERTRLPNAGGGDPPADGAAGGLAAQPPSVAGATAVPPTDQQVAPQATVDLRWFILGNPKVVCESGSTLSVAMPSSVGRDLDFPTGTQIVWYRVHFYDTRTPNTPIATSQWFFNVLEPGFVTTDRWYQYRTVPPYPLDAWISWINVAPAVDYSARAEIYWQSGNAITAGRILYLQPAVSYSWGSIYDDYCKAPVTSITIGGPSRASLCPANLSDDLCAWFIGFNSNLNSRLIEPWLRDDDDDDD